MDSIEKTINGQLPDHLKNPELFELFNTYQVHDHSRTFGKHTIRMNVASCMVNILLRRQ